MTAPPPPVTVTTAQGAVRGYREGDLVHFYGIPYAQAPLGNLRFRDPQPPTGWTGVKEASRFGPRCTQPSALPSFLTPPQSEDCLTLNILSRAEKGSQRPVLVFFHGGLNLVGQGNAIRGATSLCEQSDIVIVSLNFRLGPFGYLHFAEFNTPQRPLDTNLGLKDQIAALRWIHDNISAFGGDAHNVTIQGQSSGANAVLSLLCAPSTSGLFHRAISQSAPAATVLDTPEAELYARWFLEALNAGPHQAQLALTRATDHELVTAIKKLGKRVLAERPGARYLAPVVDGDVLPQRLIPAFTNGSAQPVPLLIGTNRDDAVAQPQLRGFSAEARSLLTALHAQNPTLSDRLPSIFPTLPRTKDAIPFSGDLRYWIPSLSVAEGHSCYASTYMYRYDWSSRLTRLLHIGATHSIELIACFDRYEPFRSLVLSLSGVRERSSLRRTATHLQKRWMSFVTSGHPGHDWPRYNSSDRRTLVFHDTEQIHSDPRSLRRTLWSDFDIASFNHQASIR